MITLLASLAVAGIVVAAAVLVHAFRMPHERGSAATVALRFMRWLFAAVLAASAIWIAIAPRADQPLLDALERAFPAIRFAYMDDRSRVPDDSGAMRAERAGAREKSRWWIGGVLLVLAASLVVSVPRRSIRTSP
jgi:hypothetical protein